LASGGAGEVVGDVGGSRWPVEWPETEPSRIATPSREKQSIGPVWGHFGLPGG